MAIEELLTKHIAALDRNSDLLERVIAGQEAALAKLGEAPKASTGRGKKAAEAPAASEQPAAAPLAAEQPASDPPAEKPAAPSSEAPTQDKLKEVALAWRNENPDEAVIKAKGEFLVAMTAHFGAKGLTGPNGLSDPEQLKQAIFYVRRKAAGLEVDFGAEYDFDGDPAQGGAAAPAAEEEDPLG